MANAEGINPARHEVERQLDRMLAHPLFQARSVQTGIFAFLVDSALNRRKVEELDIFLRFYPEKNPGDGGTDVRTNVNFVRKLLKEYYEGDGQDDPVIITLPAPERIPQPDGKYKLIKRPPGEAYKPVFGYNPRSAMAKELTIASHLLSGGPAQIEQGLWHLDTIFKTDADQWAARYCLAFITTTYAKGSLQPRWNGLTASHPKCRTIGACQWCAVCLITAMGI
jgi:hypothetical protein